MATAAGPTKFDPAMAETASATAVARDERYYMMVMNTILDHIDSGMSTTAIRASLADYVANASAVKVVVKETDVPTTLIMTAIGEGNADEFAKLLEMAKYRRSALHQLMGLNMNLKEELYTVTRRFLLSKDNMDSVTPPDAFGGSLTERKRLTTFKCKLIQTFVRRRDMKIVAEDALSVLRGDWTKTKPSWLFMHMLFDIINNTSEERSKRKGDFELAVDGLNVSQETRLLHADRRPAELWFELLQNVQNESPPYRVAASALHKETTGEDEMVHNPALGLRSWVLLKLLQVATVPEGIFNDRDEDYRPTTRIWIAQ